MPKIKTKSRDISIISRRLREYKEVEIMEAHTCIDYIHMLVKIPLNLVYHNLWDI